MSNTITKAVVLFLFLSLMLDFGLGTRLSNIKGLSLKNIAIFLMIILFVSGSVFHKKRLIRLSKINKPILFFVGYCFLSFLINYFYQYEVYGTFLTEMIRFKTFADPFILCIVIYTLVDDIGTTKIFIGSLLIVLFAFNLITIMSSLGIANFSNIEFNVKFGRTSGAFSEPNQYAAYVSLFMPICVMAFFHSKSFLRKTLTVLLFVTGMYSILLTGSRGGVLSFVIGLGALNILNAKRKSPALVFKTIFGLLAIGVLVAIVFSFLPEESKLGMQGNFIGRAEEQDLNQYSSGRLQHWVRGLNLFIEHPIFGAGYGTYVRKAGPSNSHNDYLLYLSTTGIIGFFLFIRIYYKLFKSISSYKKDEGAHNWCYNGYLAGLVSFSVSMFFVNIMTPNYFFYIYSGLVLSLGYLEKAGGQATVPVTE